MKKMFMLLLLILFIYVGYLIVNNKTLADYEMFFDIEDEYAKIDNYFIYGNHLNIEGNLELENTDINLDNISLILKSNDEENKLDATFEIKDNTLSFNTSEYINGGINLDSLKRGNWYLLIKIDDKYYSLKNNTSYENLEYYTMTKNNSNNLVEFKFIKKDKELETLSFVKINVSKTKLPDDVYDITIDPGHGGVDSGAFYKLNDRVYTESDITLEIALKLKKQLEKEGYKVLLTRQSDVDLDYYGENGRAVLPNKYHTKLCLSLHLNSDSNKVNYGGVEVYIPNNADKTFATNLASNIANNTSVGFSKKIFNKIEDGVYFNYFNENDIKDANENYVKKNMKQYDIKVGAPEMYMIREVGGIATHAYVDDRNSEYGLNQYYDSNQTAEGYLVELAYISYEKDLNNIIKSSSSFASAINNTITDYYN